MEMAVLKMNVTAAMLGAVVAVFFIALYVIYENSATIDSMEQDLHMAITTLNNVKSNVDRIAVDISNADICNQ